MYKLPQEYLSVDPAGIILKKCCESLITEQGSFTLFVCIKIDPSGKEVFVPCSLKCTGTTPGKPPGEKLRPKSTKMNGFISEPLT